MFALVKFIIIFLIFSIINTNCFAGLLYRFNHNNVAYQIDVKDNWKIDKALLQNNTILSLLPNDTTHALTQFNIQKFYTKDLGIDLLSLEKHITNKAKSVANLPPKIKKSGNNFECVYSVKNNSQTIKNKEFWWIEGDFCFVITYRSLTANFPIYLEEIQNMVKTFRVL